VDWKDVDEATDYQPRAAKVSYMQRTYSWAAYKRTEMKIAAFLSVAHDSK
jgi:hypothetical protein